MTDSPLTLLPSEGPDTDLSLEEREIGGLGILLVKNVMDETYYKRHVDKNVITLVKKITL